MRWLQVGGAAVGVGMAVAVAPAVAWADDAGSSSSADSPRHSTARHGGSDGGQRPGLRHETSAASERSTYGDDSEVPDTPRSPRATAAAVRQRISDDLPESAAAAPAPSSAPDQASEVVIVPQRAEPVAEATSGGTAAPAPDPLGQAQAFLGLPGAPATAAPSLGALPILLRLNVEDVFTGTGPPVVSNPTGGSSRGIPNSSLTLTSITADVATLVPTQNQIDLTASLKFPLQNPAQLEDYFNGGTNEPYANPVVTANNGRRCPELLLPHHLLPGVIGP
ncbi:hypothetical protein [Mycolicibacterium sp.]|uniref:hypothetical protein n=1 Tax=Mycolicibacterium sp. TaxID=2320850 RepID=UPI0028A8DCF8|nr:hypothetical protein [Mycolicibacterium sp.]